MCSVFLHLLPGGTVLNHGVELGYHGVPYFQTFSDTPGGGDEVIYTGADTTPNVKTC